MEGACDPATTATSEERRLRLDRSSLELVTGAEEDGEEEEGWAVGGGMGDLDVLVGGFCEGLGSECTPVELCVLADDSEWVLGVGEALPEVR